MAIILKNILALTIVEGYRVTFLVLHKIAFIYQINVIIQYPH